MQTDTRSQKRAANKKKKKTGKIFAAIIIIVLLLVVIGAGVHAYNILNLDTFYKGVLVDGVNLEGRTLDEALNEIKAKHQPELDAMKISLQFGNKTWEYGYKDIDAKIDIDKVVNEAYQIGRKGEYIDRLKEIYNTSKEPKTFNTKLTYNVDNLKEQVENISKEINVDPVDATITFNPHNDPMFTFTEEKIGRGMLVDKTMADIKAKVDGGDFTPYQIPVEELHPKYTLAEVKTWTSKLSVYSTKLSGGSDRVHNITLSSKSFDGVRIDPGNVYSFNESTGPRDKKHGYRDAPVIKQGKKLVPEPGGGNCQTSTTLYGAALRADLQIAERYNHSWPSSYTEIGQDATVNYPSADLKIKNPKDSAVFIRRYISNGRLFVEVYGKAPTDYDKIEVVSTVLSSTPAPPEKVQNDPTMYKGQTIVEYKSRTGYKVQSYRVYYKNGKVVKKAKEALSVYPRITGKMIVGTKEPPKALEPAPSPAGQAANPAQ